MVRAIEGVVKAGVGRLVRAAEPLRHSRLVHELAVAAIFREEAPFLDEWIAFHHGVGATHFFLYNNFSTDNYADVLRPWIAKGIVTLVDWPVKTGQRLAYADAVRRTRAICRWVAFIDLDEFLFSPDAVDIRPILRRYEDLPGIEVWQVFFGASGREKRPDMPVTEAYLHSAGRAHSTVKTIANPRLIRKVDIHQFKYWSGSALDPSRHPVTKDHRVVLDPLRMNHYWSRSLEDLSAKIGKGDAASGGPRDPEWHLAFEKTLNREVDESILPIARAIRAGLKEPLVQPSSRLPSGS